LVLAITELTLEDGTDRMSLTVIEQLPTYAA
jgi:hypothetical protein